MKSAPCTRRGFIRATSSAALGAPFIMSSLAERLFGAQTASLPSAHSDARVVSITACRGYGPEVRTAMKLALDQLGGIGSLVRNKTVTIKVNLTGTNFASFLDRPVGETYMTHFSTAQALTALLFEAGAGRVRLVESTQSRASLDSTLDLADWDVNALRALGKVEFENTRNLGSGKSYSHLKVPAGGYMFSALDLNHCYGDTDVMVSLCKLKNHVTAGVTLSMKNLFGITPNSLYGDEAASEGENATAGRGPIHNRKDEIKLPGIKAGITSVDATWRVPRTIVDICAARPVDLAIIDGITSMSGGEGPWCSNVAPLKFTSPGVLIVGRNPVSTDAVGTAVMGYPDPRALRGVKPFHFCDNHLLMAEQAGLGTADLSRIEVRGLPIEKARYPYS